MTIGGRDLKSRISRIIREYDAQGHHRTGTEVDDASGRWLAKEVLNAGLDPILEAMPFSRIDVQDAYLEVEGTRIEGLPLFDSAFTDETGIAGRLESFTGEGGIGVGLVSPMGGGREFINHRRATGQSALVAVTAHEDIPPGLTPINAEGYRRPHRPPVLQIGSDRWNFVEGLIRSNAEARLVSRVRRTDIEIFNVNATLEGRKPDLLPLVVMTPRSGWWRCASERGPGIAVWLEMIRSLASAQPDRTVQFVASTGHELGHYGLEYLIEEHKWLVRDAFAWIHLGANFGGAVRANVVIQPSDEEMRALALGALDRANAGFDRMTPIGSRPFGEARNVFDLGGRYISILGRNGLFHHPDDRWPDSVDVDKTARLSRAFTEIGLTLARAHVFI